MSRRRVPRAGLLAAAGTAVLLAPQRLAPARLAPALSAAAAPVQAEPRETPPPPAPITRRVGRVTVNADPRHAYPGGLLVVRLISRTRLGVVNAIFDGRRVPFLRGPRGPRAILPLSVPSPPGPATLGIEILARRRRQRIAVNLEIAPRTYPPRSVLLNAAYQALLERPNAVRDGRRLLQALREPGNTPLASDRFLPPVNTAPAPSFGGQQTYLVAGRRAPEVEACIDSIAGEYHHGLDYDVPVGTPVRAPAGGRVVLAAPLTLSGWTVVINHGEAVASVFQHLSTVTAVAGQVLAAGDDVGRTGHTGLAPFPHLHWGVYVHGVPVDPRAFLAGLSDATS